MTINDDVPRVVSPHLFRAIEGLVKEALRYSGNHPDVRAQVVEVCTSLRLKAVDEFGHDTPEVVTLVGILHRTDSTRATDKDRPDQPRQDPIKELEYQRKISLPEVSAAHSIAEIWTAFSRFLVVAGRSFDGGGGKRRNLSPLDVMSQSVFELWRSRYTPWYNQARTRIHKIARGNITSASIVLKIVVEGLHPYEVDSMLGWKKGKALKVLRAELDLYDDPSLVPEPSEDDEEGDFTGVAAEE